MADVIRLPHELARLASANQPGAGVMAPASDPRVMMPRAATLLNALVTPLVLATAGDEIGPGFLYRDVVGLVIGLLIVSGLVSVVRWHRLPARLLWLIVGLEIVFVASLATVTGGGASPYFALYAPVLAIAGWYLVPIETAALVALVIATEGWRGVVIEGARGQLDQLQIGLPFFALVAALAALSANRLSIALAVLRRDQVRTAAVLEAVGEIASDPLADPLHDAERLAGRAFGARAVVLPLHGISPRVGVAAPRSHDGYAEVPIAGAEVVHGLLQLRRPEPFSATEVRLAGLLGEVAGRAADARWVGKTTDHAGRGLEPRTQE